MALKGAGELRTQFLQFPVFVRSSVLLFSRLSATEMASSLCCSVGIASAVQTAGTPRCRGQRTELRATFTAPST